jgi:hypothetical protein
MNCDQHPEPKSDAVGIPPRPPSTTGTLAGCGEPEGPTPRALVVAKARNFGLTNAEVEEVVQKTGWYVAACIVGGSFDPTRISLKEFTIQFARWSIADVFRKRRQSTPLPGFPA